MKKRKLKAKIARLESTIREMIHDIQTLSDDKDIGTVQAIKAKYKIASMIEESIWGI